MNSAYSVEVRSVVLDTLDYINYQGDSRYRSYVDARASGVTMEEFFNVIYELYSVELGRGFMTKVVDYVFYLEGVFSKLYD